MAGLTIELDAAASNIDGTNPGTAYALSTANGYALLGFDAPEPEQEIQWASSADTEGELPANIRYHNRTVTIRFRLAKSSDALLQSELNSLTKKVGKLTREGGTLKVTVPSGTVCYFDILTGAHGFAWDTRFLRIQRGEITLTFPCKPFIRTAEVDMGDNVETTLPWLIFTDTSIAGDVPALGRLVFDNDSGTTHNSLIWGIQSRYYSNASTAALFYEAESCALFAGTSAVAGPAGASGAGSNVARNTAVGTVGVGVDLLYLGASSTAQTHIGTFRVFARVQLPNTNTGTVSVRAVWRPAPSAADVNNPAVEIASLGVPLEAAWYIVDLGLVSPPVAATGSQGWLGRMQAWSTVGTDDIDIDWIALVPVDEGYGDIRSGAQFSGGGTVVRYDGVWMTLSGSAYKPPIYAGDFLLVPPSGAESRTIRMTLHMGTGVAGDTLRADADIPDISARLFVTPRYLTLPA